ncbi:MAG: LysE family transporter [Sporomusaceae bacterium]|nr:LysE family transporter [Sporomusaceae bacterium]
MDESFFLKGLILGFSIAAPVGPIGLLCIRRTLTQGMAGGFISGLGAATADGFYGAAAAFGLTVISQFFLDQAIILQWFGSFFLVYLGWTTLASKPGDQAAQGEVFSLGRNYLSTFFLTITNPMTILSFGAVFSGLGLGLVNRGGESAVLLVGGVVSGSILWWLCLSCSVAYLKEKISPSRLVWVNRFAGILLLGFGIAAVVGLVKSW